MATNPALPDRGFAPALSLPAALAQCFPATVAPGTASGSLTLRPLRGFAATSNAFDWPVRGPDVQTGRRCSDRPVTSILRSPVFLTGTSWCRFSGVSLVERSLFIQWWRGQPTATFFRQGAPIVRILPSLFTQELKIARTGLPSWPTGAERIFSLEDVLPSFCRDPVLLSGRRRQVHRLVGHCA